MSHCRATAYVLVAGLACVSCSKRASFQESERQAEPTSSSRSPRERGLDGAVGPARGLDADANILPSDARVGSWNILLISIDSLRADMPWAGYSRPIAPRLTSLHAQSISYSHAYATSSFTSKSIAGILSGRYPSELLRTGNFFTKYLAPSEFICTSLAAQNVPCVAAHAHAYFGKGQSGFESGFQSWKLVPNIAFNYQTDPYITSDRLTTLGIEMLGQLAQSSSNGKPFFAWLHYMDPHDEYQSHKESPHFGTRPRDLYDEEVFFSDLSIGKLLDFVNAQPWSARTAIIVTADHGEAFGEHGVTRHAHELWEELIHVPLFFFVPGRAARVIEAPRGHVDLAPTFVEWLGATPIQDLQGGSLSPEVGGAVAPLRDVISDLPEDEYNERRRALIHSSLSPAGAQTLFKLIAYGADTRFSLYNLTEDPKEATDLVRQQPSLFAEMRTLYREASARIKDIPPRGGIPSHARKD